MRANRDLAEFPGGDLVIKGLGDLESATYSEEALLMLIARPRLLRLGFAVPVPWKVEIPEHALYEVVEQRTPNGAHSAYNALIQRIVSFAEAYSLARTD